MEPVNIEKEKIQRQTIAKTKEKALQAKDMLFDTQQEIQKFEKEMEQFAKLTFREKRRLDCRVSKAHQKISQTIWKLYEQDAELTRWEPPLMAKCFMDGRMVFDLYYEADQLIFQTIKQYSNLGVRLLSIQRRIIKNDGVTGEKQ